MKLLLTLFSALAAPGVVDGFVTTSSHNNAAAVLYHQQRLQKNDDNSLICLNMAKKQIGLIFGTSTGSTETVAEMIAEEFGDDIVDGPMDIEAIDEPLSDLFSKYDALIVGTPTWNTGADTERSGTGWDEIYYSTMPELNLDGKKVAVFGLGDQISYGENYADATGELHDVFENLGCQMMGYTSQEGYEHTASKSIRGDLFCGLLCDMVNQEDLTEERVTKWVAQLKQEGILQGGGSAASSSSSAAPAAAPAVIETTAISMEDIVAQLEKENAQLKKQLEENSKLLDQSIASHDNAAASGGVSDGYTPHLNSKTGVTMWTSPDGRSCYYTSSNTATKLKMNVSP